MFENYDPYVEGHVDPKAKGWVVTSAGKKFEDNVKAWMEKRGYVYDAQLKVWVKK